MCIDNMQRDRGGPLGLYGCHGLTTQRWRLMRDGVISNGVSCIRHETLPISAHTSTTWTWSESDGTLRIDGLGSTCLTDMGNGNAALQDCAQPPPLVGCCGRQSVLSCYSVNITSLSASHLSFSSQ